jgi:hypothetical protein
VTFFNKIAAKCGNYAAATDVRVTLYDRPRT